MFNKPKKVELIVHLSLTGKKVWEELTAGVAQKITKVISAIWFPHSVFFTRADVNIAGRIYWNVKDMCVVTRWAESHGSKLGGQDFREKWDKFPTKNEQRKRFSLWKSRGTTKISEKLANKIINGGRERKFTEAYRFSRKCNNNQTIKRNSLHNTIGSDEQVDEWRFSEWKKKLRRKLIENYAWRPS